MVVFDEMGTFGHTKRKPISIAVALTEGEKDPLCGNSKDASQGPFGRTLPMEIRS